jgi:hypothetical protein
MKRLVLFTGLAGVSLALILGSPTAAEKPETNPPADGFDLAGSDARAIALADRVMARMGGRQAWDQTRYIRWSFFGRRHHVWDKYTGNIRVEGVERETEIPYLILMNIHTKEGRAWESGEEVTDPGRLAELLDRGEAVWINDSYWLVMPYKLKDSGVTLAYLGEGTMEDGSSAEVLQLTFKSVGRTPDNKYHVYVAKKTGLVEQWSYYRNFSDEEPGFTGPWRNWQQYGQILLSDNRGERGHTNLAVYEELPASVFTSPEPVDWSAMP